MWYVKADPRGPKGSRGMLALHGLVGCLTVMCVFVGFSRLPVGDAATIIFSNPVITIILSFCLLKEHCGIYRILVILILLAGVALVAQPPALLKLLYDNKILEGNDKPQDVQNMQHYDVAGYVAAVCGTLLTAANFVMVRKLKDVHFSVLIFSFSVMSLLASLILTPLVSTFTFPPCWQEWTYCILVGLSGYFGQVGIDCTDTHRGPYICEESTKRVLGSGHRYIVSGSSVSRGQVSLYQSRFCSVISHSESLTSWIASGSKPKSIWAE